jgi:RNA polymerase sigma factor (sigma-70 family)
MAYLDDPEAQRANRRYVNASMRAALLSRDHELSLARRWREEGDVSALHEFVCAYTRLVIAIAARFRHYGLPMGDLVQEGNVGLMQAAMRFDPGRDIRFSSYATWWIRSAIQRLHPTQLVDRTDRNDVSPKSALLQSASAAGADRRRFQRPAARRGATADRSVAQGQRVRGGDHGAPAWRPRQIFKHTGP